MHVGCHFRDVEVNSNRRWACGFSLVEMIGVLVILAVLFSFLAPKVFEQIRASKVSAALQVHESVRQAAAQYMEVNRSFPPDGTLATHPDYARPYGDGAKAPLTARQTTFGDLLLQRGMLKKLVLPIGTMGGSPYAGGSPALVAAPDSHGTFTNPGVDYPMVFCNEFKSETDGTKAFTAAMVTARVVFMLIPGLTTLQAGEVKRRLDGPFREEEVSGLASLVTRTVAAKADDLPRIRLGNCRITAGLSPGMYDCWLYVAHE